MRSSIIFIVIVSLLPVLAVGVRDAGPQPAARPAVVEDFSPLAGASSYDLVVEGVRLGQATLEVQQAGDAFSLEAVATIHSAIGSLYAIRYGGHAVMAPRPVQPTEAVIEERKGMKTKTYLLKFPEPGRASAEQLEAEPGKKPVRTRQDFFSDGAVLDPFSAVFFVRSHDWRVGEVQVFDLLTGRKQYEVELTCRGETSLAIDGRQQPAWEIGLQTRSHEAPRKIKLAGFVVYLAKEPGREVLRITGKYRMGRIVIDRQRENGRPVE